MSLWESTDHQDWAGTLARYPEVIARQGVAKLPELDRWYREVLPGLIAAREPAYLTREELLRAVEWKMARGVWRGRNLALARSNLPETVEELSRDALRQVADGAPLNAPIATLSKLAGVGPATASAVVAAAAPAAYPFFDDLVAAQIPGFGAVDFTPKVYARYADALRARASDLGAPWTPTLVERALWSASGGKVALQPQ